MAQAAGDEYIGEMSLPDDSAGPTKLASYPWYFDDWRGSEARAAMNGEERSLYRELLDHCWERGSLPNCEKTLQNLSATSRAEFKRSWPKVAEYFVLMTDNRYHHRKVDEKRPALIGMKLERKENASKAGKASAEAKAARQRDVEHPLDFSSTKINPSPSPSPSPSTTLPESARNFLRESVERLYAAHPKKSNLVLVPGALISAVNGATDVAVKLAAIEKCHAAWCATDEWKEKNGRFAPKLDMWLADRGYSAWPGGTNPEDYNDPKRYEHGE